jgi:hypothetical protein
VSTVQKERGAIFTTSYLHVPGGLLEHGLIMKRRSGPCLGEAQSIASSECNGVDREVRHHQNDFSVKRKAAFRHY